MGGAGVTADQQPGRGDDGGKFVERKPAGQYPVGVQPCQLRRALGREQVARTAGDDDGVSAQAPGEFGERLRGPAPGRVGAADV